MSLLLPEMTEDMRLVRQLVFIFRGFHIQINLRVEGVVGKD